MNNSGYLSAKKLVQVLIGGLLLIQWCTAPPTHAQVVKAKPKLSVVKGKKAITQPCKGEWIGREEECDVFCCSCGTSSESWYKKCDGMIFSASRPNAAEPFHVDGVVARFYIDRSGYVTAMDVQNNNGTHMIHFAPNMGQRLYTTYPVGGNISVWVSPSSLGTGHWNAVGVGPNRPTSFMDAYTVSAVDLLESEPMILTGAKMTTVHGKLSRLIVNDMGEVLGLVLDNQAVVRVPRELRQTAPGYTGSERITPLIRGALVSATGYPEAPRYGLLSPYGSRLIANTIAINGRSVGASGVPLVDSKEQKGLFKADIGGSMMSNEEMAAMGMGYQVYSPSGVVSPGVGDMAPGVDEKESIGPK